MDDEQIIQEINFNLNHQITEGSVEHQLFQVVVFLFEGEFDEVYLELSRTKEGSQ